jgi:hypothetical protein
VCDKCLRACCWHGIFLCDDNQTAGLLRATEAQLRALNREHPDYFMPHFSDGHDSPREPILSDSRFRAALEETDA